MDFTINPRGSRASGLAIPFLLCAIALIFGSGEARAQGVCPACKKFRATPACPADGSPVAAVARPVVKRRKARPGDRAHDAAARRPERPAPKPPTPAPPPKPQPRPGRAAPPKPAPPQPMPVAPASRPATPKFDAETTNAIKSSLRAARQDQSSVTAQKDAETNIIIALAQNADPNVRDQYPDDFDADWTGETALFFAARRTNLRLLNELLKRGGDVDVLNREGENALHACAQANPDLTVEVATRLIEEGADYNRANGRGETPLIAAAKERNLALVAVLLTLDDLKADAADSDGWTALHWAVQRGDADVVTALVAKKVNLNAKSKDDKTPLQMARDRGDADIIALLESAGAKDE